MEESQRGREIGDKGRINIYQSAHLTHLLCDKADMRATGARDEVR